MLPPIPPPFLAALCQCVSTRLGPTPSRRSPTWAERFWKRWYFLGHSQQTPAGKEGGQTPQNSFLWDHELLQASANQRDNRRHQLATRNPPESDLRVSQQKGIPNDHLVSFGRALSLPYYPLKSRKSLPSWGCTGSRKSAGKVLVTLERDPRGV